MIVIGFVLRMIITGFSPVTNMFETIVFVALCAAMLSMWLTLLPLAGSGVVGGIEKVHARKPIALAGAVVALAASILAYYAAAFPKDIRPLMPVLRSNVWLAIHVLTITAGYGAAALAWAVGNLALGFTLFGGRRHPACAALADLIDKILQVAVWLLLVGTVLAALWADVSWGRFWGWDPKEVWVLVSLLVYLLFLHGRSIGWCGSFMLALASVCGIYVDRHGLVWGQFSPFRRKTLLRRGRRRPMVCGGRAGRGCRQLALCRGGGRGYSLEKR